MNTAINSCHKKEHGNNSVDRFMVEKFHPGINTTVFSCEKLWSHKVTQYFDGGTNVRYIEENISNVHSLRSRKLMKKEKQEHSIIWKHFQID